MPLLVIAAVFSPLAAVMAFIITYREYDRHSLPKRELIRRSLHAAAFTLAFFIVLAAVAGWFLDRHLGQGPGI